MCSEDHQAGLGGGAVAPSECAALQGQAPRCWNRSMADWLGGNRARKSEVLWVRGIYCWTPQILFLSEKIKIPPEPHILPFLTRNLTPLQYNGTTIIYVVPNLQKCPYAIHEDIWIFIETLFIIAKSQEQPQMSINRWMHKRIVVYSYNGMLFSNQKECTVATWNIKDESF